MQTFEEFWQSAIHKVSVGPFESATTSLVKSDIVLHLPVLEYYASKCDRCVEFGVRTGESTVALIAGCNGEVISYDIQSYPIVKTLEELNLPCKWLFRLGDTGGELDFDEADLLFIDTLHTYTHVKKELIFHGRKARKYLIFHDTLACGEFDLTGPNPKERGIMPAIQEFVRSYPGEYVEIYKTNASNGLLILERHG